jgi:hypothetical protein
MKIFNNFLQVALGALVVLGTGCSTLYAARNPTSTSEAAFFTYPRPPNFNKMPFIEHKGPGRFDNTLALNLPYEPIVDIRLRISQVVGRKLFFFTGWNPNGEAHVTTISPVEYSDKLKDFVSIEEINELALKHNIQQSDLSILGIGSGSKVIDGVREETFFIVVESQKLRMIRKAIWELFVKNGGDPTAWNHASFYPHITIGFTKKDTDLHEPDVLKDMSHSFDQRFFLSIK